MKTIIVPIDFSDVSETVVGVAITLAKALDAELLVLHVIHEDLIYSGLGVTNAQYASVSTLLETKAEQNMEPYLRHIAGKDIPVRCVRIVGLPVEKISNEVERTKPELIVMGTHRHGLIHKLVLGSTSFGVLKQTQVPIVLVPSVGAIEREQRRVTNNAAQIEMTQPL